jgi:hypothetical protein
VNKHVTLRKDANILSRHWVFGLITNNPILVDPLTAECVSIIAMINGNEFNVRSLTRSFCDIWETFFGKMKSIPKSKCKNSE